MSAAAVFFLGIIFCFLARLLYFSSVPAKPIVYGCDNKFLENIVKCCACLNEIYRPPGLWGRSGHLQTIIHGLFGRVKVPYVKGERRTCVLPDGATTTFDVYETRTKIPEKEDYLFLVCPGIANSSESVYIQTFVTYALKHGYHVLVQNHLGTMTDVKLTAPRIFTYGGTEEFHSMVTYASRTYASHKMIAVGFSMGGNIITKYLGEKRQRPHQIVAGISICQGYDALRVQPLLLRWEHMRRLYLMIMTETVKDILRSYRDVLFAEHVVRKYRLEERKIFHCQTLCELDEYYWRRVAGCSSLTEYYLKESSSTYLEGIEVPMMFVNAIDDPIVPTDVLDIPKNFVEGNPNNSVLVLTKHGGHLGFFEGGIVLPSHITWVERLVVEYADTFGQIMS